MWEASWGIIAVIVIMFGIGLLASPAKGETRARSRRDLGLAGTAGTGATSLNTKPDIDKMDTALKQAAKGVTLGVLLGVHDAPPTPAEKAAGGK